MSGKCMADIRLRALVNETATSLNERATPLGYVFNLHWANVGFCSVVGNKYNIFKHEVRTWVSTDVSWKVPIDKNEEPTCVRGACRDITYDKDNRKEHPPSPDYYSVPLWDFTVEFDGSKVAGCCDVALNVGFYLNPHTGQGVIDHEGLQGFSGLCHITGKSKFGQSCYEILNRPPQAWFSFEDCVQTSTPATITSVPYYS
ncbi:uncharacterized protein L969DRAFT_94722 [Mixia osmundae IAM 14324]|nr:uncharacterized protein L969DRAFT_94722 [Mixia osmundae IAM 14324]KEI39673.1 hypothetical protein L969DRAFT_94722 [Mixia osmundae IAM 14324]